MLEGGKSTVLVLDYIKERKEIFSNVERRPFVFKVETFPQKSQFLSPLESRWKYTRAKISKCSPKPT